MPAIKQKAIIHIGAGHMQIESIRAAKELGLYVIVTDKNPEAPGISYADEYHCCAGDDEDELVKLAHKMNTTYNIIAAYSSSDFGLLSVAKIHAELDLHGCSYLATKQSLNKYSAKQNWLKHNVNTPKAKIITHLDEIKSDAFIYPVIIKPKDSCGSQGICSVSSRKELEEAIKSAFNYSDQVLIEEYIEGKHYDTIGIMWQGKFIPMGIGNRYFSAPPYHFPIWGHTPSDLSVEEIATAYEVTANAAASLNLDFTPVKGDLIFSENKFSVIEISPRFHGDVFTAKLIPLSEADSPIKALFQLRLSPSMVQDGFINSKVTVLWKALFPFNKTFSIEHLHQLSFSDIFLNNRKVSTVHKDNTTLQGFIWDKVPPCTSVKKHYLKISEILKDFL